jgi:hypothetical protein
MRNYACQAGKFIRRIELIETGAYRKLQHKKINA